MIWDYERLVLEEFPKVYKVKCMNHTRYLAPNDIKEIIPGHVSLVVVANLRNHNSVNLLKPQSSLVLLERIRDFIAQINPPCVELHVKNPIYEEIFVKFNVRFHPGIDPGSLAFKIRPCRPAVPGQAREDGRPLRGCYLNIPKQRPAPSRGRASSICW